MKKLSDLFVKNHGEILINGFSEAEIMGSGKMGRIYGGDGGESVIFIPPPPPPEMNP